MALHAKLSPSAAHRWMNCAGSVNLIGDESSSAGPAAWLGTAAHKVVEVMLQNGETDASEYLGRIILVHTPGIEDTVILKPGEAIPPDNLAAGWQMFICDDTMVNGVQMMIDEVERVKADLFDPVLYTERYLDGSWLDPRLGGTADATLVEAASWIHLFDYKNGRIVVEVKNNEQMKNYGVFLLREHPDALGVVVHLVQPNAVHEDGCIREERYLADELKLFEIQLKAAAEATTPANAPRRAGDWCTYCPGKDRCPEFAALAYEEAGADFASDPPDDFVLPTPMLISEAAAATTPALDEPEVYEDEDSYHAALARKARWIPLFDQWARDLRGKILAELMNQKSVGDWKLVRGKSNRVFPDEVAAQAHFNENGIGDEHLFEPAKLKSPAKIEKLGRIVGIKPAVLKTIVAEVAHKPEGKVSIASGSDPREALDPVTVAAQDFAGDPAEDFEP